VFGLSAWIDFIYGGNHTVCLHLREYKRLERDSLLGIICDSCITAAWLLRPSWRPLHGAYLACLCSRNRGLHSFLSTGVCPQQVQSRSGRCLPAVPTQHCLRCGVNLANKLPLRKTLFVFEMRPLTVKVSLAALSSFSFLLPAVGRPIHRSQCRAMRVLS
jgi:hypothetical protein